MLVVPIQTTSGDVDNAEIHLILQQEGDKI